MINQKNLILFGLGLLSIAFIPDIAMADVMGSLQSVKGAVSRIFPIIGILGLLMAGLSFFTGNPNASNHLKLALIGAAIGFGAESLITFVDSLVN